MEPRVDHLEKLQNLLVRSAHHIEKYGHHQFDMWEGKACCIMGAPRMVDEESSYSHILRDILAYLGYDEPWNDKPGRTAQEVVAALQGCVAKMTPETLQAVYGPRWRAILDFIVAVDDWDQDRYAEVENLNLEFEYSPDYALRDKEYLNALGSYMTTVMTSEKASQSSPYKKLFDGQYKTWTDSEEKDEGTNRS